MTVKPRGLLTGAGGFVGQALLPHWQALDVVGADLCGATRELDVLDREAFLQLALEIQPKVLIHAAGLTTAPDLHLLEVNVRGTLHALEAAKAAGVEHFVFFSSSGVYAPNQLPTDEASPTSSSSAYALSKLLGEDLCRTFLPPLTVWILRLGAVYGGGEQVSDSRNKTSIVHQIARAVRTQTPLCLPRVPSDVYNWLHAKDLARLLEMIALRQPDQALHLYNVGGEAVTVAELLAAFAKQTKKPLHELVMWSEPTPRHGELVCTRVSSELGWQPQVPLADGIGEYL